MPARHDAQLTFRIDLQHHLFTLTLGGQIYSSPIGKMENLHKILDVGTGTGVWAMDLGMCPNVESSE